MNTPQEPEAPPFAVTYIHQVPLMVSTENPNSSRFIKLDQNAWIEIKPDRSIHVLPNDAADYIESIYQKCIK